MVWVEEIEMQVRTQVRTVMMLLGMRENQQVIEMLLVWQETLLVVLAMKLTPQTS